jgi:hypothetical protein
MCSRNNPFPIWGQAVRTSFGRPSSSVWLRVWDLTNPLIPYELAVAMGDPDAAPLLETLASR